MLVYQGRDYAVHESVGKRDTVYRVYAGARLLFQTLTLARAYNIARRLDAGTSIDTMRARVYAHENIHYI